MKVIDLYRKAQGDIWGRTELLSVDTCSKYIEDTLGLKEEYAVAESLQPAIDKLLSL